MKTPVAVSYEPIMVGAAEAAALCGTSRSNWLAWDAVGLTPRSIHINSRVLWAVETLASGRGPAARAESNSRSAGPH